MFPTKIGHFNQSCLFNMVSSVVRYLIGNEYIWFNAFLVLGGFGVLFLVLGFFTTRAT